MPKSLVDIPEVAHIPSKLDRAKEHIAQLERELTTFENEGQYAPIINDDPQTAKAFYDRWRGRYIPPRFGIIAGEVLYQLRSSLDHIHCALIVRDGGQVVRKSQFPIFQNKPVTRDDLRAYERQVAGIRRKKVLASIKRHQPYTRRTRLDGKKWLGTLNVMGNADKHHAPVLFVGVIDPRLRTTTVWPESGFEGESNARDDGAPFALSLPLGDDFVQVLNVERRLTAYIAFPEIVKAPYPQPVAPLLSQLTNGVTGILNELAAFL